MTNVKACARCGVKVISNLNFDSGNYYRHLSVKYCDECRKIVRREQNSAAVKRYRKRKRAERTAKQDRAEILQQENEMLRRNYSQLCDAVSILRRELEQIKHEADRL